MDMRVAIYTKGVPGMTAKAQEAELRRLCQQRGWIAHKSYVDLPGSPKLARGKERIALLDALFRRRNQFGAVCVWRMSMLGNCSDDLLWVLNEIHVVRGIHIVAPGDGIDSTKDDSLKRVLKVLNQVE